MFFVKNPCCCPSSTTVCTIWYDDFSTDQPSEYIDDAKNGMVAGGGTLFVHYEPGLGLHPGVRYKNITPPVPASPGLWFYVESTPGRSTPELWPTPYIGGGGMGITETAQDPGSGPNTDSSIPDDLTLWAAISRVPPPLFTHGVYRFAGGPVSDNGVPLTHVYCNSNPGTFTETDTLRLEVWDNGDGTCDILFFTAFGACVHRHCGIEVPPSLAAALAGPAGANWGHLCIGGKDESLPTPRYCEFTPTMFSAEVPSEARGDGLCTGMHFWFRPLGSNTIYFKKNGLTAPFPESDRCVYSLSDTNGVTWREPWTVIVQLTVRMYVETLPGNTGFVVEMEMTQPYIPDVDLPPTGEYILILRKEVEDITTGPIALERVDEESYTDQPKMFPGYPQQGGPNNCMEAISSIPVTPLHCVPLPPAPPCPQYLQVQGGFPLYINASIGGGTYSSCMFASYDPDTRLWSWSTPSTETVELGTLHGEAIVVELYATIVEDGTQEDECHWWVKVTLVSTGDNSEIPAEIEDISPVRVEASGNLPELSGIPFAGEIQEFYGIDEDDHPLMRCCNPDIAEQCGLPKQLMADATPVPFQFDPCSVSNCDGIKRTMSLIDTPLECNGNPIGLTGYSPGNKYFISDFPATTHPVPGADAFNGHKLLVWCDGSNMRWARLDEDGCVHSNETGTFTTWDCESFSGTIEYNFDGSQDCCDGFGLTRWDIEVAPNL